jgi:hypothetical protein
MIEGRATGTCSLGPLIRADVAASDSLPGTGLIKWRGSCELLGVFSPQMGAAVTFSYTIQGKATQTIPKKFRVLSSFADPLANNGRGQTTVELGCLLTYMEDAAEPTELKSRDDDELGNESQSDEDFDAIGASVSARFAFKQCANAIGVSFNFRDGALESTFRVDTIDLKVGYISVMSDLLVSESMVGELDANEVLQIRKLTEAAGEAGKLLNTSNILSIAPLNAGELPGENVAVEYSSWRLKEPDENDGLLDPWEKVITVGPEGRLFLGFTYLNTRNLEFGVGIINTVTPIKNYFDYTPVQETTTYYREVTVDGQTRSVTDRTETVLTTSLAAVMPSVFISWFLTVGTVIGISDLEATSITTTEYEYNERGEVTREVTEIYEDAPVLVGKLGISVGRFISSIQLENLERTLIALLGKEQFLTGRTIVEYEYSSDKRLIVTKEFIHYAYTQEGQQAAVETGTFVRLESDVYDLWNTIGNRGYELVPKSTVTQTTLRPSRPENVVPSKSERLSVGSTDDPLERSTETVWVYGDQQSIRRRVFRMPFAPDDLVTGTSGNYSVTPSNAEDVARLFGRVQNKLLFGARYGVQLQLLPVQVPAMAFDALNVDLAGVMGQFRLNNLSYVIEPGEVVCGCNALYWGTIGSTPYSGTASGSWVPLPASSSGYTAPQDVNTVEAGTTVVISSVGTTSQEDWNTLAGTSGVTYSEGDTITAVVDGSTLDSSTGTVSTLQPAPTPTSDATLGDVVVTSPEDVQEPFSTTERYRLSATRGRFLLTGLEADVRQSIEYELAAGRRVFSLTGRQVTQSYGRTVTAGAGALAVTGNDAAIALQEDGGITADAGSFAVAGSAAVVSAEIAPFDPWTPYEIDTALWLDADDAATITVVSGAISQWDDKSTNGYALAQATASKRPAISAGLLNGKDVINCAVVSDPELEAAGSGPDFKFLHFGQATVVALARVTVNAVGEYISTSNGTLTPARAKYGWNNGYRLETSGSEGSPALLVDGISTTLTPLNSWNIVITTTDTAQSVVGDRAQVYINGTQRSPSVSSFATATDTDPQRDLVVCGGDSGWDGQIAEIITLSRVVTTDERQILEGYLAHKWGQTASLPDGHPWKVDSPPSLDFGRGSYAVTGLPADLTYDSRNLAAETGSISLTYKSNDPIPATYSQSSRWFGAEAATAEGMTNGIYAETLQTATDNDGQFDIRDWVQMDFGQQIAFSKVIVGADFDNTLAGGWGVLFTEFSSIRASNVGGNNPADWTTLVADIGEFTQGIQEYATPGASYRYVRLVGQQSFNLVVTEFYAV